jgi:DNA polymerase elongation subunit (family B)
LSAEPVSGPRGTSTIVLDVETLGLCKAEHQEAVTAMAAKRQNTDPEAFVALCPPMARIVCVGLLHLESGRSVAYLDGSLFPGITTLASDEKGVLACVNGVLSKATRIVTFSGRTFDLPVLVHRMVALGVAPCSRLVAAAKEYRYRPNAHVDIAELFTFFGATSKYPLRAYCLGHGVEDPKADGDGAEVAGFIERGDSEGLSRYCLGDVNATAELYRRWTEAVGIA